jgi:hypothetical protein
VGANAEFRDGNDLYRQCSAKGYFDRGVCSGYVTAIADVLIEGDAVQGRKACIPSGPNGAPAGHLVAVARQFLAGHPAMRHQSAEGLIASALAEAYPCK